MKTTRTLSPAKWRLLKLKKRKRFLDAVFNRDHPGHEDSVKQWLQAHRDIIEEQKSV